MLYQITAEQWAASAQAISYWVVCAFYELIDYIGLCPQYRIRPSDEESRKNTVSRDTVFRHMVVYHITTSITIFLQYKIIPPGVERDGDFGTMQWLQKYLADTVPILPERLLLRGLVWILRLSYLLIRQFLALVILDTWVFWGHYVLHKNPWLYRKYQQHEWTAPLQSYRTSALLPHSFLADAYRNPLRGAYTGNVHAIHHRLYTPFSYGALYNHWAESTFSDGIGGWLGTTVMRLTAKEQIFFFAAITAKTVEDHVQYELPWSPFTILSHMMGTGPEYHGIHHASWGLKVSRLLFCSGNDSCQAYPPGLLRCFGRFSQPTNESQQSNFQIYFTWWDRWMETSYHGTRSLKNMVRANSDARGNSDNIDKLEIINRIKEE